MKTRRATIERNRNSKPQKSNRADKITNLTILLNKYVGYKKSGHHQWKRACFPDIESHCHVDAKGSQKYGGPSKSPPTVWERLIQPVEGVFSFRRLLLLFPCPDILARSIFYFVDHRTSNRLLKRSGRRLKFAVMNFKLAGLDYFFCGRIRCWPN